MTVCELIYWIAISAWAVQFLAWLYTRRAARHWESLAKAASRQWHKEALTKAIMEDANAHAPKD